MVLTARAHEVSLPPAVTTPTQSRFAPQVPGSNPHTPWQVQRSARSPSLSSTPMLRSSPRVPEVSPRVNAVAPQMACSSNQSSLALPVGQRGSLTASRSAVVLPTSSSLVSYQQPPSARSGVLQPSPSADALLRQTGLRAVGSVDQFPQRMLSQSPRVSPRLLSPSPLTPFTSPRHRDTPHATWSASRLQSPSSVSRFDWSVRGGSMLLPSRSSSSTHQVPPAAAAAASGLSSSQAGRLAQHQGPNCGSSSVAFSATSVGGSAVFGTKSAGGNVVFSPVQLGRKSSVRQLPAGGSLQVPPGSTVSASHSNASNAQPPAPFARSTGWSLQVPPPPVVNPLSDDFAPFSRHTSTVYSSGNQGGIVSSGGATSSLQTPIYFPAVEHFEPVGGNGCFVAAAVATALDVSCDADLARQRTHLHLGEQTRAAEGPDSPTSQWRSPEGVRRQTSNAKSSPFRSSRSIDPHQQPAPDDTTRPPTPAASVQDSQAGSQATQLSQGTLPDGADMALVNVNLLTQQIEALERELQEALHALSMLPPPTPVEMSRQPLLKNLGSSARSQGNYRREPVYAGLTNGQHRR